MNEDPKDHWRQKLGIEIGTTKDQALERFREWREKMKTCQRCEGEKLVDFCPIHLICEEAENEQRDVKGDDYRGRIDEIDEYEALRAVTFEARERPSLR